MRRWLGNIRFTLGALHQVWQQRRYAARVAVYPADPAPPPSPKPPAAAPDLRTDSAQNEPGYAEHDQALQGDSPYQPPRHMRTRSEEQRSLQLCSMQQQRQQSGGSGIVLSELCRQGPPTPILDALGDAANVDLEAITQQHPVRIACCRLQAQSLMHGPGQLACMHLPHACSASCECS